MEESREFEARFRLALAAGAEELELGWATLCKLDAFVRLAQAVLADNEPAGLTTIVEPEAMARKHFLDSLVCLKSSVWQDARCAVDVGSGAGFPGLVLAIALPRVRLTLIEASAKKAAFLDRASRSLGLVVDVLHERAEDFGRSGSGAGREKYDVGLARATAKLAVSCEYVLPLVKVGGSYLVQAGPEDGEALLQRLRPDRRPEASSSAPAWQLLGARLIGVERFSLPENSGDRYLARLLKVQPTPAQLPRRAGKPGRDPLGGLPG